MSSTNINDVITRVWQSDSDLGRRVTITVDTPEKSGGQFSIPIDTPFGRHLHKYLISTDLPAKEDTP